MTLLNQVQELLDLASHVAVLLQKQSDLLTRKRNLVRRDEKDHEDDFDLLAYDIALASRSLQVLGIRREIQSTVDELVEVKEELQDCNEELMSNWFDYIQDTMEHLHVVLTKGLELAQAEDPEMQYYDSLSPSPSSNDLVQLSPLKNSFLNNDENNNNKIHNEHRMRANSNRAHRPASIVFSSASPPDRERRIRSNLTRRHTLDSEGISVARLFIGNIGFREEQQPLKTSTSIPEDQVILDYSHDNSRRRRHQISSIEQITNHDSDEMAEEFVDAMETHDTDVDECDNFIVHSAPDIKQLAALTQKLMRHTNSTHSFRSNLDAVVEDDSRSNSGDNDDVSSCTPASSTSSSPPKNVSSPLHQIDLGHDRRPANLFAENVTVGNPSRVGFGYRSYIVYTCTVRGQEGASVVVRKRYSEFVKLRAQLVKTQPAYKKLIPKLPPKKVVGKFNAEFIERRRKELDYFLTYVLLHPVLGATAVVRRWFCEVMAHG